MPPPERVSRFDVAEIGKAQRTPQGFLRVPAFLTRVGVFAYKRADGTTVREYRPSDEVFKADSLASLRAAPVTDLHPTEMVSPANVRKLSIGHVYESARQDGDRVAGHLQVEDDTVIKLVERGDRREVSMGYQCRVDATPGEFKGEAYDVVQRDIVYNHAALGPRGWGRQGRDIALRVDTKDGDAGVEQVFRMDSSDALNTATFEAPGAPNDRQDQDDDEGDTMDQVTLRVDGLDALVPKQSGQVIEKALKTRDDSLAALTKERDTLQGKLDGVTKELGEVKTKLAAADDPKRLDAAVNARATLLELAGRVLPAEHKYDGQTVRQIHEAVLTKLDDKVAPELKDKSDEYVLARFDHAMKDVQAGGGGGGNGSGRNDALDEARRVSSQHKRNDPPPANRQDAKPFVPDWQKPLNITKDQRS